jgi:hypothetical protein
MNGSNPPHHNKSPAHRTDLLVSMSAARADPAMASARKAQITIVRIAPRPLAAEAAHRYARLR